MRVSSVILVLVGVVGAVLVLASTRDSFEARNVKGTYNTYGDSFSPGGGGPISSTACAPNGPTTYVSPKLLKKYPWVAINQPTFKLSNDGDVFRKKQCGKCAMITNPKNGKSQKFVVVDIKGEKGVDMSPGGFNMIGVSVANGSGPVNVKEVPC